MAGPVERGLLRGRPAGGIIDREEAYGVSPRAEPGGSQVAGDRPEREAGGRVAGRRGVERGGGLGEDGVSEADAEVVGGSPVQYLARTATYIAHALDHRC